jgi:hypothetical protein
MNFKLRDILGGITLVVVLSAQAALAQPDPGDPGPFATSRIEYNLGDTAFTPPGPPPFPGPVEINAVVHYPTDLSSGPFPLIIFMHGRHATCYQGGSAFLEWPCAPGHQSITSYQGYEYMQGILASNGYIVASVGANGINARDNSVNDLGMLARAQTIQYHLDLWNTWNTVGGAPFEDPNLFLGKVNMNNIGTMGHSRGGEGVARHFVYNRDVLGNPYTINAVLPLAPVDFQRPDVDRVPMEMLVGYCDGDVSDLQGAHFYDDVRYTAGDPTPKHNTLTMGANHNFFNTVWTPGIGLPGAADDWTAFVGGGSNDPWCGTVAGNHRLTAAQQRAVGLAYTVGFFRRYIGGETVFDPLWKGDAPPPPSAMTTEIYMSYQPPDDPARRLDLDRLQTDPADLTTNMLGGAINHDGLTPYNLCGGLAPQDAQCLPVSSGKQPHTVPSARSGRRGLPQFRFGWGDTTAFWSNDLPPTDVSSYAKLQFRASVNWNDPRNPTATPQDFTVALLDGSGGLMTTVVSANSGALYYPPGGVSVAPLPKTFLSTVRIDLANFPGVDLTNITGVVFYFDQTNSGALLISDLAFAD